MNAQQKSRRSAVQATLLRYVGLLYNQPPARGGLLFVLSSDYHFNQPA
jgi:hypothetical protein